MDNHSPANWRSRLQWPDLIQGIARSQEQPPPVFYADAVVVAYRRPAGDVSLASLHPTMTASAGSPDFAMLDDGDLQKTTELPVAPLGETAWIQYEFAAPQTIRAITYVMARIRTAEP